MIFSRRTNWDLSENDFARSLRLARTEGRSLLDLTISNPIAVGFSYEADTLLQPLSSPGALSYDPVSFGMPSAREGVAEYYAEHGASVCTNRICLTTSTSEAYSYLFRLLCDGGDEVLIARPSYPLFDFIAQMEDVTLREYPLLYNDCWQIDFETLEAQITDRTRAIVVVHPNNPTGNYASLAEQEKLKALCSRHKLALIVDEVFLDYAMDGSTTYSFLSLETDALTFVLSGISKVCALPQMKISWFVAHGPDSVVDDALARLDVVADTYLSVNAPTQFAMPFWLKRRGHVQDQIRRRVSENLSFFDSKLTGTTVNRLALQGGWTVIARVPRHVHGVPFAQAALERNVIVQPAEFFGLSSGHVVLSLLTPPDIWRQGIAALLELSCE